MCVSVTERDETAADILGDLFNWLLDQCGAAFPEVESPESHFRDCRVNAWDLRNKLYDLALEYPFDWREAGLNRRDLTALGIPTKTAKEVREMREAAEERFATRIREMRNK